MYASQKSPPPAVSYGYQVPPQYGHQVPPQYDHQMPPQYGQYTKGVPVVQPTGSSSWSTGLFDCGSDVSNCCITYWCPCITLEIVDRGTTSCGVHGALYSLICILTGCGCTYSCIYRSKMRQQYMLPETPCNHCCVHCCCEACALCQEYRALKNRGFDMDLGWQENMQRQNQGIVIPSMISGGMTR